MSIQSKVRSIVAAKPSEELSAKEGTSTLKRSIPKGFTYDPRSLKPLARMLLSLSISLGHGLTAYKEFTKLKSSKVSPDGMVGGQGYVMTVKEVRAQIQQACELLSAVSDTIHDEINAPHWQPKIEDLSSNDAEDIAKLLEESKDILSNPESYGKEEAEKIESDNDGPKGISTTKPWKSDPKVKKELGSQLPGSGSAEVQERGPGSDPTIKLAQRVLARVGNSSQPVECLPGGPRVQHLDRADSDQTGPFGSYNQDEPLPDDPWGRSQGVGPRSENKLSWDSEASSGLPSDTAPFAARDFGIGFSNTNDLPATEDYGSSSEDGYSSGKPHAGLPGTAIAPGLEKGFPQERTQKNFGKLSWGESELPGDGTPPVSRSDYYEGDKGNNFNVSIAESTLPGGNPSFQSYDRGLGPNVSEGFQDFAVPYVKRDWSTSNDRHDKQDLYQFDRKIRP